MSDRLSTAPSSYVHSTCGTSTRMPDSVRSRYLYDPYYFEAGLTICAHCGLVPDEQCTWNETGQNLDEYMRELRRAKKLPYHIVRWGIWALFMAAGAIIAPSLLVGGKGQIPAPWNSLFGVLVGGLTALFIGRYLRFIMCRIGVI
jgi:hypothetical protein